MIPVVTVSGNLSYDANGNGIKLASGEPNVGPAGLYAYFIIGGVIIDKTPVLADGTFSFTSAPRNTNNTQVMIGKNSVALGPPPLVSRISSIVRLRAGCIRVNRRIQQPMAYSMAGLLSTWA